MKFYLVKELVKEVFSVISHLKRLIYRYMHEFSEASEVTFAFLGLYNAHQPVTSFCDFLSCVFANLITCESSFTYLTTYHKILKFSMKNSEITVMELSKLVK